jgi:hypothetical protein
MPFKAWILASKWIGSCQTALTACERATAVRRLTDRMFFATVDVAGGNFQGCIDA